MIGGYRLRCMDYSWLSMWQEQPCNFQGQPRPMGCNNYRALQWYAFWLNATLGFLYRHGRRRLLRLASRSHPGYRRW